MAEANTTGRGGKAARQRIGSTHYHSCAGTVYGCLLPAVLQFVKRPTQHVSEAINKLKSCLQPVAKELMLCDGVDVKHLLQGFACSYAIRGQLSYIPDSKHGARIDARYGKKSVVVGLSACVYYMISSMADRADNTSSILLACDEWVKGCCNALQFSKASSSGTGLAQEPELMAERRAIERAHAALLNAKRHSKWLGLNAYDSVRMCIAHVRKAMWPAGKRLDERSQPQLLAWIADEAFREDIPVSRVERPTMNFTFNVPLSAIPTVRSTSGGEETLCDTASSSGSYASSWSASSVASDAGMDAGMYAELSITHEC